MIITIKITTDNAAFEGNRDGVAFDIAKGAIERCIDHGRPAGNYTLRDSNGNTVGTVTVRGK